MQNGPPDHLGQPESFLIENQSAFRPVLYSAIRNNLSSYLSLLLEESFLFKDKFTFSV